MGQNCFRRSYSFKRPFLIHEPKNLFRTKGFSACHSGILFFKRRDPLSPISNESALVPLNFHTIDATQSMGKDSRFLCYRLSRRHMMKRVPTHQLHQKKTVWPNFFSQKLTGSTIMNWQSS